MAHNDSGVPYPWMIERQVENDKWDASKFRGKNKKTGATTEWFDSYGEALKEVERIEWWLWGV